jgi:hypothetical protein
MTYRSIITTTVLSLLQLTTAQIRPPNLSPDNLPDTAFTCEDKVTGGYYADVEADCQLFHVCVQVSEYEFQDFHFLCPNDTVFDQQHLVCTNWFEVDCHAQLAFFTNDFGIKRGSFEDEDINEGTTQNSEQGFLGFSQSGRSSRLRNTGRGQLEVGRRRSGQSRRFPTRGFSEINEYDEDEDVSAGPSHSDRNVLRPAITGTPIPLGFTTTIRPAGNSGIVNSGGFLSGRNLVRNHESSNVNESDNIDEPAEVPPKSSFAKFGRDGRRPKVKSNIRAKLANSGGKKNFFQKADKTRKKSGRKVNLDHIRKNRIEFVEPNEEGGTEEQFSGPEVRPDGRSPRVKSNILSEHQNRPETTTLEPFIEQFFASPSSPQPFVFKGSPTPRPFGSASTAQPFFIPTVKSPSIPQLRQSPLTLTVSTSSSDPTPPPSKFLPPAQLGQEIDQGSEELVDERGRAQTNRFLSRPSPARFNNKKRIRGRNRVIVKSEEPSFSHDDITTQQSVPSNEDDDLLTENTEKPRFFTSPRKEQKPRVKSNLRHRKKKIHTKFNNVDLNSVADDDCNNPFECPPKSVAAGRRPRVKSNVRAGKRNFWQKQKSRGFSQTKNREFGVGQHGRNRKIRRGRKQKSQITNEIANQSNEINDDESDLSNLIDDSNVNEPTQQFFPTTRTTPRREFTTKALEEENEIFDDFFDQQNDLFVASSTVSPVVFKGSPGPGFFSSPRPNFDSHGSQVSFTSPNPFGPGGPSGRPSFNNIGAHIDLGPQKPQKILEPEQLFFISSTVSNKIFIGSEEETTTPTPVSQEEGNTGIKIVKDFKSSNRNFPSFPIRAGSGGFPFKPKPDFSRRNKSPFRFGKNSKTTEEPIVSEKETESVETTEPIISSTESLASTTESAPIKLSIPLKKFNRKSPRVKSNLLFNRKNRPAKNKFAQKLSFSTTELIPSEKPEVVKEFETESNILSETEAPSEETQTESSTEAEEVVVVKSQHTRKHRDRFQHRNKFSPLSRVPNISATNSLLSKRKFRGRGFGNLRKATHKEDVEIITEAQIEDSGEQITTTESQQEENILSVESELFDDAENEENDTSIEENAVTDKKKPRKKWPSVKKANNANIRVEFKKKTAAENKLKGFFVKPDGRKPRVKSNIRAKFAHRGQQFGHQHDIAANGFRHSTKVQKETFDGASSQLDLTPFAGSEEDNTEKREINISDSPFSPALLNQILNKKDEKHMNKENSFPLPLQPVILNPRQLRDPKPSLPPAILQHISHITNIKSLPPLPSFARTPKVKSIKNTKQKNHGHFSFNAKQPTGVNILEDNTSDDKDEALQLTQQQPSNSPSTLLEQIVANSNENSQESLPHNTVAEKPTSPGFKNKLSAFRALQKQIEKSDESSDITVSNDYSSDELTDHIKQTDLV